jgi:5-methylcytosine-specific restriction endonuclease McrA
MPPEEFNRQDKFAGQLAQFKSNKKRILATQDICGICGKPVDKSLKYPHPFCATVDCMNTVHAIIPIAKGGHPSDLTNLQLAHFCCNRQKSDRVGEIVPGVKVPKVISNRLLPLTFDWKAV